MPDKNQVILVSALEKSEIYNKNSDLYFDGKISDEFLLPIIESYIRYYASGDGHTAKAKRNDLLCFLKYLSQFAQIDHDRILVLDWTLQKTKDFVDSRIRLGESPATVSRRLATLKHLGRTLSERVQGFINPAREVKAPHFQLSKPQGLSADEINLLKNRLKEDTKSFDDSFIKLRNCVILELLLSTGLRADEIRILTRGQFSENSDWIFHVKTKGKRFRDVYIPENLRALIKNYLERSKQEIILKFQESAKSQKKEWDKYPFLISCHRAKFGVYSTFGLAPKTLWTIISDFGKSIRINEGDKISHLHPHKLRHTFAHGLLNTTNDVRLVAQALGHSDVRTTMRYTERTKEHLASAIEEKEKRS